MKNNVNQNEVVGTSKTTTKQFRFSSDQSVYNQPSAERKYTWKVAGQTLYVNEEEFKHLRQMYHWDELQELAKHSRCQVCGKNGKLITCPRENRCDICPIFRNGWKNNSALSLDASLDEDGELTIQVEDPTPSIEDRLIQEEFVREAYKAIDELEDPIDRFIMRKRIDEYGISDKQVADYLLSELGIKMSTRGVNKRVHKLVEHFRERLKEYRN